MGPERTENVTDEIAQNHGLRFGRPRSRKVSRGGRLRMIRRGEGAGSEKVDGFDVIPRSGAKRNDEEPAWPVLLRSRRRTAGSSSLQLLGITSFNRGGQARTVAQKYFT